MENKIDSRVTDMPMLVSWPLWLVGNGGLTDLVIHDPGAQESQGVLLFAPQSPAWKGYLLESPISLSVLLGRMWHLLLLLITDGRRGGLGWDRHWSGDAVLQHATARAERYAESRSTRSLVICAQRSENVEHEGLLGMEEEGALGA